MRLRELMLLHICGVLVHREVHLDESSLLDVQKSCLHASPFRRPETTSDDDDEVFHALETLRLEIETRKLDIKWRGDTPGTAW